MKQKAIKKVQRAIDAIIDLREDCNVDTIIDCRCQRLLDSLRDLEFLIDGYKVKAGQLVAD